MQHPNIIVALCFAACLSGALAQTKETTAQYNALGAAAARVVRDKGLDDPDSFRAAAPRGSSLQRVRKQALPMKDLRCFGYASRVVQRTTWAAMSKLLQKQKGF